MSPSFVGDPIRLGVMTDIQYANKPDKTIGKLYSDDDSSAGLSDDQTNVPIRRYTRVLQKTENAVTALNASNVAATLHLGDIIDGNERDEDTLNELTMVVDRLKLLDKPMFHVVGNHCLHAGRQHLQETLGLAKAYYVRDLSSKWRIVVLDTLDVGMNREEGHPLRDVADQYLREHEGEPNARRWNGTVGPDQVDWLKQVLAETRKRGMLAIVCGHIPLYLSEEHGAIPTHSMWQPQALATALTHYSDVVKAYFAGHHHAGSYVLKDAIHYVTFESILDSQSDHGSWGIVELYQDGLHISGYGDTTTRELKFA